jgi:hypothetical protein
MAFLAFEDEHNSLSPDSPAFAHGVYHLACLCFNADLCDVYF